MRPSRYIEQALSALHLRAELVRVLMGFPKLLMLGPEHKDQAAVVQVVSRSDLLRQPGCLLEKLFFSDTLARLNLDDPDSISSGARSLSAGTDGVVQAG